MVGDQSSQEVVPELCEAVDICASFKNRVILFLRFRCLVFLYRIERKESDFSGD